MSPVEQTDESTFVRSEHQYQLQKCLPTPFLTKTHQLVEDSAVDELISWNNEGTSFVVWRPAEFARDLLPKYFKHNNFSSFVRQLNTYGFKKVMSDRWEFAHECFKKGEKDLLREIQRRKISPLPAVTAAHVSSISSQGLPPPQPPAVTTRTISTTNSSDEPALSSSSSPTAATPPMTVPELMEDNERLGKENDHLREELNRLKALCGNVYHLMSNYSVVDQQETSGGGSDLVGGSYLREEVNGCPAVNGGGEEFEVDDGNLPGISIKRQRIMSGDDVAHEHEHAHTHTSSNVIHEHHDHDYHPSWLALDINTSKSW